jgi:hypothetical protein
MMLQISSGLFEEKTKGFPLSRLIFTALLKDVEYAREPSVPILIPTPKYFPKFALVCSHETMSEKGIRLRFKKP